MNASFSPQNPRLHFAGEATSHRHYSTVHGAYESGIRAANEILENMAKKDRVHI